jgi:hypothetical protein
MRVKSSSSAPQKMTFGFLTKRYCGAAQQCVASSFQGFLAYMAQKFGHTEGKNVVPR